MTFHETRLAEGLKRIRGRESQVAFSRRIGVAQTTYSNWEIGRSEPPLGVLAGIAKEFGVSVDWLLGLTDSRTGGGVATPPRPAMQAPSRDAEVARLWALVESQQRTIEALAKGGGVAGSVPAGSSASSRVRKEA